ncbi:MULTISPECIES: pentapeptide repeat-containing protein [unclassified Methanosarcina]|uniref:pentapeptide repeat-containing protein n=1 Tax=unclassified Methanosarcina TaxID=2644672 RepID=UPI00350EA616
MTDFFHTDFFHTDFYHTDFYHTDFYHTDFYHTDFYQFFPFPKNIYLQSFNSRICQFRETLSSRTPRS